jgi:hypothetical protein
MLSLTLGILIHYWYDSALSLPGPETATLELLHSTQAQFFGKLV